MKVPRSPTLSPVIVVSAILLLCEAFIRDIVGIITPFLALPFVGLLALVARITVILARAHAWRHRKEGAGTFAPLATCLLTELIA